MGILSRKVAGVPVVYLLGVGVVVLAIVAWRMNDSSVNDAEADPDELGEDSALGAVSGIGGSDSAYDQFADSGPAVQTDATLNSPSTVDTNSAWVKRGAQWAAAQGLASAVNAQTALGLYVDGQPLTYDQGVIRDRVVAQQGFPPEDTATPGKVGAQPFRKQFNPPGTHTIKSSSDNQLAELATGYYGSADLNDKIDLLQSVNPSLNGNGPYTVGTHVKVPAYHKPIYYKATAKIDTAKEIAARNATTASAIVALNDGMKFPVKSGTRVRVH